MFNLSILTICSRLTPLILKINLMHHLIKLLLVVFLSYSGYAGENEGARLSLRLNKFFSSTCLPELSSVKNSKKETIKFIEKLQRETGCQFDKSISIEDGKTIEYVAILKADDIIWSVWFSVNDSGMIHLTETWQSRNQKFLRPKLFLTLKGMYETLGNPTHVIEHDYWFMWDLPMKNCGIYLLTMVENRENSFVTRRLGFQNEFLE